MAEVKEKPSKIVKKHLGSRWLESQRFSKEEHYLLPHLLDKDKLYTLDEVLALIKKEKERSVR